MALGEAGVVTRRGRLCGGRILHANGDSRQRAHQSARPPAAEGATKTIAVPQTSSGQQLGPLAPSTESLVPLQRAHPSKIVSSPPPLTSAPRSTRPVRAAASKLKDLLPLLRKKGKGRRIEPTSSSIDSADEEIEVSSPDAKELARQIIPSLGYGSQFDDEVAEGADEEADEGVADGIAVALDNSAVSATVDHWRRVPLKSLYAQQR
ncbi:unnamed protein product [Parajaminaea phylloscopi]